MFVVSYDQREPSQLCKETLKMFLLNINRNQKQQISIRYDADRYPLLSIDPCRSPKTWLTGNCVHGDRDQKHYTGQTNPQKGHDYLLANIIKCGIRDEWGWGQWRCTGNTTHHLEWQEKRRNSARTHDGSCCLSWQHLWGDVSLTLGSICNAVTIPGHTGPGNYRQGKEDKWKESSPFQHSCLYILFWCRWLSAY